MSDNFLVPLFRIGAGAGLVLGLITSPACRGEDLSFDCENQERNFRNAAETEAQPLITIPDQGPYPVAVQLSEQGLNELLAGVIDEDVPFVGEVPFGILPTGPGEASFESDSDPEVRIADVPGCSNCILFAISFGVELDSDGEPLSSGRGWAEMAVPLTLRADENAGTTTLVADYSTATIHDWYLSVFGFTSDTHTTLAGALRILMEENIQEGGEIELLTLGSWEIGRNEVRMVARNVEVYPEFGKVALGMHTNLPLDAGAGLDLQGPMPDGIPMTVSFDTGLMLDMSHRMLEEGEIPRIYNEAGEPDPTGIYGVTLGDVRALETRTDTLQTEFRVWRFAEGYCGFATLSMDLQVVPNDSRTGLLIGAGPAVLVEGENEGIGVAAEEERSLVDDNQELIDTFRRDLAEQLATTLNYEELAVEDSNIVFTNLGVAITSDAIESRFNLLVLEDTP